MSSFKDVIEDIEFSFEDRKIFREMAGMYEKGMPDTLFKDPYELHTITGIENKYWKRFLRLPQVIHLIESEIALVAEIKARDALNRLGNKNVDTSTVTAIKALLDKSKLLQGKTNENKQIIFHHIPLPDEGEEK